MQYPMLSAPAASRQTVDVFRGYNHNLRIGDGEFFDMENLTSDDYPVLSPRGKRGVYAASGNLHGLIAKDALCYVDGSSFMINGYPVDMGLTDTPKQLVSMGAYVIILPDKKWINTMDHTQFGDIEASFHTADAVSFSLCDISGNDYDVQSISPTQPENPDNRALWMDTSAAPHALKQWSDSTGMWAQIPSTYVKLSAPGIGSAFAQYDGVTISGIADEALQALNASAVIWARGEDYIVVPGLLDGFTTQTEAVTVERRMPDMDFITEAGNRLWGCRYGVAANGEVVNELYACKLGDFKNWNCTMQISTDSWVQSVGTDGPFTGAATHLGYPVFFKENCLHKVYISSTGAHQVQDTACRGVQRGCEKSLAIVNETLFYKGRSGICAYDGALPVEVSAAMGNTVYGEAVGGAQGNKYYVSMQDTAGTWHLFVYDTAKGMWHKEDNLHAACFCACRGELYAIDADAGKIIALFGSGTRDTDPVTWMAETGDIGISSPDRKYISRLTVRLSMALGAQVRIFAQYDWEEPWLEVADLRGTSLRSFSFSIRPRRCDHMKLRFAGVGMCRIYAITKTIEGGSDIA